MTANEAVASTQTTQAETETPDDQLADPEPPRLDVVFGVLQNRRRRLILRRLEAEPSTTIGDLAEHIAAIENDVSRSALRSAQRKRVYVSLYQSHLPKLDDAGVIDFDQNRGTVEATDAAGELLRALEQFEAPPSNPRRERATQTLAGAGLLAAALVCSVLATTLAGAAGLFLGTAGALAGAGAVFVVSAYRRSG